MGLIEVVHGADKVIIPSPLGLEILCLMGMVKSDAPSRYLLVVLSPDESKDESDELEDA